MAQIINKLLKKDKSLKESYIFIFSTQIICKIWHMEQTAQLERKKTFDQKG